MTTGQKRESIVDFLQASFNLSTEEFEVINQQKRKALKDGKSDEDFWVQYAKEHNIILPKDWSASFSKVMKDAIGVNQDMYALVEKLKANGIPVALLSNIDQRRGTLIKDFGLYKPFAPCLLSYELSLEKPDPRIYQVLLNEMNLPAHEILFIDDMSENIDAAKTLGFDTILFTSQEQLQKELVTREILNQ